MLVEYLHHFADRLNSRNVMDYLQTTTSTREGLFGISAAVALVAGTTYYRATKIDRGVPQVPASGIFGSSTDEYRVNPPAFIEKWSAKLGVPVYGAQLFGQYATIVSGPAVREIFMNDDFSFVEGAQRNMHPTLLSGIYHLELAVIADGIKRYLSPNLKQFTKRVIEHLEIGLDQKLGTVPPEGVTLPHVYPILQHAVALASASVFVGPELANDAGLIDSFKNLVIELGKELKPKPWLEPFPKINRLRMWWIGKTSSVSKRHREQLRGALAPEVSRRLKAMKENDSNWERPDDVLQSILENEKPPAGVDMVDYLVTWCSLLIFVAIHTTSEHGTVFVYRLLQNPKLIQDLYEEQNEILQLHGYDASAGPEVFTRELLNEFVKMDSAIRETGRLRHDYYALPHTNMSNKTIVLSGGASILPGENAFIDVWSCHHDPEMQGVVEDFNTFKPFRYLDQGKNATKIGDDFLFFGLGRHACPGRWLAIQEIKTIVALLLRKYELSSPDKIVFPIAEREAFPTDPARITFKLRQAPVAV